MKKLILVLMLVCMYSCSTNNNKKYDSKEVQRTQSVTDNKDEKTCIMSGTLTLGHEVRSFKPDNSDEEYWIVDKTGTLSEKYDELTGGVKNGKPVYATLKLEYQGKWDDGFAAEYPGVYFVKEIIEMKITD